MRLSRNCRVLFIVFIMIKETSVLLKPIKPIIVYIRSRLAVSRMNTTNDKDFSSSFPLLTQYFTVN